MDVDRKERNGITIAARRTASPHLFFHSPQVLNIIGASLHQDLDAALSWSLQSCLETQHKETPSKFFRLLQKELSDTRPCRGYLWCHLVGGSAHIEARRPHVPYDLRKPPQIAVPAQYLAREVQHSPRRRREKCGPGMARNCQIGLEPVTVVDGKTDGTDGFLPVRFELGDHE
ncbi:hypothetical protein K438DRAFT_1752610 [Mycena galopus ATCC 62051]|nr:hypothetical protein K438DRAFT_1752610 [Mycena galopus ATCC 62051]